MLTGMLNPDYFHLNFKSYVVLETSISINK